MDNLNSLDRIEDIDINEVKNLEAFKDWDDEQILELISTIKTLSHVIYNNWSKKKEIGKEIALHIDNQLNVAA